MTPALISAPSTAALSVRLRSHYVGWCLVAAGLVATLLTPRQVDGPLHEFGRAVTDGKLCPYNLVLVSALCTLIYLAYAEKSMASFYQVAAVMGVETGLFLVIKYTTWWGFHVFARPSGGDGGFPSGHTAAMCALAYLLTSRWPRLAPLWYGFAALVGWARWTSGAHYPYQVVAGAALGLTVATVLVNRPFDRRPVASEQAA